MKKLKLALYIGFPLYGFLINIIGLAVSPIEGENMVLMNLNIVATTMWTITGYLLFDTVSMSNESRLVVGLLLSVIANIIFWLPIAWFVNKLITRIKKV